MEYITGIIERLPNTNLLRISLKNSYTSIVQEYVTVYDKSKSPSTVIYSRNLIVLPFQLVYIYVPLYCVRYFDPVNVTSFQIKYRTSVNLIRGSYSMLNHKNPCSYL